MGMFKCPMRIESLQSGRTRKVKAIVDTGAAYTILPGRMLRDLGVEPEGDRSFRLADGRRIDGSYGQVRATIDGGSVTTIVIFGADDGPSLLGAYTLEGLGLAVDPVHQRLVPAVMTL